MIYLTANVCWPFKYDPNGFKDYFFKTWQLAKYKFAELQIYKGGDELVGFTFRLSFKQDHAGLMIELSLFRRSISFQYYDSRHWDHENNCYQTYEDKE